MPQNTPTTIVTTSSQISDVVGDKEIKASSPDLDSLRSAAADDAFLAHDFSPLQVAEISGWEHTSPGNTWTRPIFIELETPEVDSLMASFTPETDSVMASFIVVFEDGTASVSEAYGILDGNII